MKAVAYATALLNGQYKNNRETWFIDENSISFRVIINYIPIKRVLIV